VVLPEALCTRLAAEETRCVDNEGAEDDLEDNERDGLRTRNECEKWVRLVQRLEQPGRAVRDRAYDETKLRMPRRVMLRSMNRFVVKNRTRPAQNCNEGNELEDLVETETLGLDDGVLGGRLKEEDALEEEEDGEGLEGGVVGEELERGRRCVRGRGGWCGRYRSDRSARQLKGGRGKGVRGGKDEFGQQKMKKTRQKVHRPDASKGSSTTSK
jgi:hypothetical protein